MGFWKRSKPEMPDIEDDARLLEALEQSEKVKNEAARATDLLKSAVAEARARRRELLRAPMKTIPPNGGRT